MINPNPIHTKSSPYSGGSSFGRRPMPAKPSMMGEPKKRRNWPKAVLLTLVGILVAGGTYAYAEFHALKSNIIVAHEGATSAILSYDPTNSNSKLDPAVFKQAGDGRINIVAVGIGGDNHPGALLTDSIQIISIDTINKKVATTSIPRDLYVTIPGHGKGKINSAYTFGEQDHTGGGGPLLREVVGNVLGIPISNFILLDFTGAQDIVDTLGGIDVTVPTAIYDPYFPDDATVGYAPFSISAGLHHMDGKTALRYARSRETTSDFDRSARQQIILAAIKKKALSIGVATNPAKISEIISTLGRHLKTDLQSNELPLVLGYYRDSTQSGNYVLDTSDSLGLLTDTTDPVAGYISYPALGVNDFSAIHQWFQKNSPDPLIAKEKATITVAGGAKATTKQLQAVVATLKDYGYDAALSTAAPGTSVTSTKLFETTSGSKPISRNYLGSQFSVTAQKGSPPNSHADFELIYVPAKN